MKKSISLVLISVLFFFAGSVSAAEYFEYTVEKGDVLSKIAQKHCGSWRKFPEIAELNNIKEPYVIRVGQVIKIPCALEDNKKAPVVLKPQKKKIVKTEHHFNVHNRNVAFNHSIMISGAEITRTEPAPIGVGMISWLQSMGSNSFIENFVDVDEFLRVYGDAIEALNLERGEIDQLIDLIVANRGDFKHIGDRVKLHKCIIADSAKELELVISVRSKFAGAIAKVFTLPSGKEVWFAHNYRLVFYKEGYKYSTDRMRSMAEAMTEC